MLVSLGHPSRFHRFHVLAALLHGVSQTLRRWTEGATCIRQGGRHVGHWPIFLVVWELYWRIETVVKYECFKCSVGYAKIHLVVTINLHWNCVLETACLGFWNEFIFFCMAAGNKTVLWEVHCVKAVHECRQQMSSQSISQNRQWLMLLTGRQEDIWSLKGATALILRGSVGDLAQWEVLLRENGQLNRNSELIQLVLVAVICASVWL